MATQTIKFGATTTAENPETPFDANQPNGFVLADPKYTDEEAQYRQFLIARLLSARNQRETTLIEYDGRPYSQNYRANFLQGNSHTPPRKNVGDAQVVTGTTREKVLAVVSAILNLNFHTVFQAFNEDDEVDEELAEAMSDCVDRANKIEMWDDKKLYAYFEMTVQGDVFLQETYIDETVTDKDTIRLEDVNDSLMKSFDAKKSIKKTTFCGPQRNIIPGTQVYLGDIRQREISLQPYLFTREEYGYDRVKSMYGSLPRWDAVPRSLVSVGPNATAAGINWRLEGDATENMCEIIKYEDKWNDEYQIFINGVMMLPVGFPLPWGYGEYDIVQGSLEPISAFFAYSKSIPAKTRLDQQVIDEMYRLAVLKTQKSFMPPIANYSANILNRAMFMPGAMNNNLNKGDIEVVGGDPSQYTLKPSEFEMIKMVQGFIDAKTVNPVLQGQQQPGAGGDQTATQSNQIMDAAKSQLGLMIFGFMQLHLKLDTIRLYNLLENVTTPKSLKIGKDGNPTSKYPSYSVPKDLGHKGHGVKHIQFTDDHDTPADLFDLENNIVRDENGLTIQPIVPPNKPQQIIQISPTQLRGIKLRWYGTTEANEVETSMAKRIEFTDQLKDAMAIFGAQAINVQNAESVWAHRQKIDPNKFFNKQQQSAPPKCQHFLQEVSLVLVVRWLCHHKVVLQFLLVSHSSQ
jgi:hypothetical protein